jgi:hypothetical protein
VKETQENEQAQTNIRLFFLTRNNFIIIIIIIINVRVNFYIF